LLFDADDTGKAAGDLRFVGGAPDWRNERSIQNPDLSQATAIRPKDKIRCGRNGFEVLNIK